MPHSAAVTSPHRSLPLQYLRGIAALFVVIYHAAYYTLLYRKSVPYPALADVVLSRSMGYLNLGAFGVSLFFATSGALMAQLATGGDPARFLLHRIVRIYPMYFAVLAGALLVTATARVDPWALALIPGSHWYPLGLEWTLPFEVTFYLVIFALMLMGLGRYMQFVSLAWIAVLAGVHFAAPALQADWQFPLLGHILVASETSAFAAGLLVPWLVRYARIVLLAPVLMIAGGLDQAHQIEWYAAASACFVAAALTPVALRARPIVWLAKLGDWSYALYLCHVTVIALVLRYAPVWPRVLVLFPLAVIAAIVAGALIGMLDLKLYRHLRRLADRLATGPRWVIALGFAGAYLAAGIVWMQR